MSHLQLFAGTPLPSFLPSVSSVKDDHPFEGYLTLLNALGAAKGLTSAYDWQHLEGGAKTASLAEYFAWTAAGGRMVLDSGWYEAYWHRDTTWSHAEYVAAALELLPTWIMSFDAPDTATGPGAEAALALRNWDRDRTALQGIPVVPIVHGDPESLPAAVRDVASRSLPGMVAVAERELGAGIVARARVVYAIRRSLSEAGVSCGVHILGTGSPISVLILALAGADSFDGVEWNRTATDFETARLYHSQHFDFFEHQSAAAGSGSYWGRTLTHNLIFWQSWMERIQADEGRAMLAAYVPKTGQDLLAAALPEVLA